MNGWGKKRLDVLRCEALLYRVFIKYIVFFLSNVIFLHSASSAAALRCSTCHLVTQARSPVYTPRKNRERPESGIYFKIFENTQ